MLAQAVSSIARESGSANSSDHVKYGGSRSLRQRFEYGEKSFAGFAELAPAFVPAASTLFARLQDVPGVAKVAWHSTKTSQGNVGNHYCEQNIMVTSSVTRGNP